MNLIAVTDIFGKTKEFEKIIYELSSGFDEVDIVDPYEANNPIFQCENEAYKYFQNSAGLEKYAELLYSKVQGKENIKQLLLGFSIGASAIWMISDKLKHFSNTKGICFYSSQVRNYLENNPKIEIDFYFSKYELTHDVNEIFKKISGKPNVNCYKTAYLHGFMNERSQNFNKEGYNRFIKILKSM
jgi:dienelactone hydrolase